VTGGTVRVFPLDVRDTAAVEAMVEAASQARPLDVLVNNAAGNFIARSEELSPRAVDAVVDIVLKGSLNTTLACGRRWLAAGRPGTVLSIVTSYAWTGSAFVLPSAAAKAGVLAMTRSLAVEWGGRGIRLNAIAPGTVPDRGRLGAAGTPPGAGPDPGDEEPARARGPASGAGRSRRLSDRVRQRLRERRGRDHRRRRVAEGCRPVQLSGRDDDRGRLAGAQAEKEELSEARPEQTGVERSCGLRA
jgi:NAD(P)-dependent dehydrogenase (short-subunit alcohol dehydrogenase family)